LIQLHGIHFLQTWWIFQSQGSEDVSSTHSQVSISCVVG
jgi:hypothetical protein